MCVLPALAASGGGGLGRIARGGLFGLAGLAMGGRKKDRPTDLSGNPPGAPNYGGMS